MITFIGAAIGGYAPPTIQVLIRIDGLPAPSARFLNRFGIRLRLLSTHRSAISVTVRNFSAIKWRSVAMCVEKPVLRRSGMKISRFLHCRQGRQGQAKASESLDMVG